MHIDIVLQAVFVLLFFSISNSLIVTVSHGNYNTVTDQLVWFVISLAS